MNLCNISIGIFLKSGTLHKVRAHKTNFISREKAEILLRRILHKIIAVDVKLTAKGNFSHTQLRILQIVLNIKLLHLIFRIIVDDQFYRIQHSHDSGTF